MVRVDAAGFFAVERPVVAVAGELVPLEVELRERPAVVLLEPSSEADVYVDGSYLGKFGKGSKVELDLMRLMMRRLTLTGSTLRAQSAEAKAGMARAIEEKIWPMIADGKFKPVIDSTFPLTDAAAAHARIDDPDHIGKIMLVVD